MSPTDPQATSVPTPAAQTPAIAPLRLRFRGGQHDGQVVRINSNKCTIGSAPNATLRLACPGVHPIHCLIMNGSGGTAIRSMSPDTLLNGETFDDAQLQAGDVLSAGPLQLEVVPQESASDSAPAPAPAPAPATATAPEPEPDPAEDDGSRREAQAEIDQLRVRVDTLQATNQQLVSKLEEVTARYEEQASNHASHATEQDDVLAELHALREQVSHLEQLDIEKQELTQQLAALQEQLQQTQALQAQREADLRAAAEQLSAFEAVKAAHDNFAREVLTLQKQMDQAEEYCRKWEAQQQKLENDLAAATLLNAEKDNELQALREKLANGGAYGQASVQPEISQPAVEQAAVSPELSPAPPVASHATQPLGTESLATQTVSTQTMAMDAFNSLADAATGPAPAAQPATDTVSQTMIFEEGESFENTPQDSAMAMLDKLRAELGAPAAQPEPAAPTPAAPVAETPAAAAEQPAESIPTGAPTSEEELQFSEPESAAPVDTASILAKFGHTTEDLPPEPAPTLETPQPEPDVSSSEDDDSIQDYMAQLMQRVGGGTAMPATTEIKKPAPAPKPNPNVAPKAAEPIKPKPTGKPLDPSEFVPRAVAPEASSGLKALRAVANTSTRSAIDRHQRRSLDSKAIISGFIALVAFGVCVAMGYLALNAPNLVSIPTLISLTSGFVGVLAAVKALAFSARSAIGSRRQQNLKQLSAR